ncbi:MAG: M48 family metallopeptidase [Xanthomonadaceae bacterium]|nr:M48 family metallopeptidase [Xanthomonadaceae bacterium]
MGGRFRLRQDLAAEGRTHFIRWSSCGRGDCLYFHWKTILLPRLIAEYVVIHELVHLHIPHHTPEFWQRLERALPDFERRKQWLAVHGMDVEGV